MDLAVIKKYIVNFKDYFGIKKRFSKYSLFENHSYK